MRIPREYLQELLTRPTWKKAFDTAFVVAKGNQRKYFVVKETGVWHICRDERTTSLNRNLGGFS